MGHKCLCVCVCVWKVCVCVYTRMRACIQHYEACIQQYKACTQHCKGVFSTTKRVFSTTKRPNAGSTTKPANAGGTLQSLQMQEVLIRMSTHTKKDRRSHKKGPKMTAGAHARVALENTFYTEDDGRRTCKGSERQRVTNRR